MTSKRMVHGERRKAQGKKDPHFEEPGWAIWNPRVGVFTYTVTDFRSCAIKDHVAQQGVTWSTCRKRGDRAVRVRIVVVGLKPRMHEESFINTKALARRIWRDIKAENDCLVERRDERVYS